MYLLVLCPYLYFLAMYIIVLMCWCAFVAC